MQQTGNSTTSSFISWAGRFRNIGLVGSAMAVLIGFIEAVVVHASEAAADDVAAHDHAADILSGVVPNAGHRSNVGASFEDPTHQLSDGRSALQDAAHQLPNIGSTSEDAAHRLSNNSSAFGDTAHQLTNGGSAFEDATHQLSSSGSSSEHTPFGHADDDALSTSASSTGSNNDHDAGSALANSDSFWFNADGPAHISLGADQGVHAATDSFAAVFDVFADNSAANAEVTFTSAELSSFQYSGPSILDTAPGGASAHWADAIDAATSTIPLANFSADAAELSELHQANSIENNIVIGGGSPKPEAANASVAGAGSAQVLGAWNGDLGSGYMSAAAAGTAASSGGVPGVISADNGQGLVINVVYDLSVASAPAGFTQTIANVVNFYESQFSNPVTITIDVGYGEVEGQSMQVGALGENQANMTSVSYSQLQAALANNADAIGDTAAAASLSATSPVNGQYWIPTAEAQALGLASGGGVDGYAGFTNVPYLDYNVGNNSGTVPGSQYDFFGVVAHEFSEIMGRQMFDGADFAGAAGYTALDLFHYSAPGVADFSGTTPGYFSPDGGYTNLGNFNTNPEGDFGDWAASVGNNSYLAYSNPGALNPVTASDIKVMNLLGWDSAASSSSVLSSSQPSSSPPSSSLGSSGPAPVVTAPPTSGHVTDWGATSVPANGVLADASDSNPGAPLIVSSVNGSAANVGVGTAGEFGVLTLNADGGYTYYNDNAAGVRSQGGVAMDTFGYTVSDNQGASANSYLTVLVTNDAYITGPSNSTIEAGRATAVLNAGAGDMTAIAGSGHQWLFGDPGDTLKAGTGTDTFMFAPNFGNETIKNFNSHDVIEFPTSLFANYHHVLDSVATIGSHTVITYDATDTITLTHFTAAQLHPHNFFIV